MIRRTVLVFVLIASLSQCTSRAARAADPQWKAGVAKVNISPELPIWLSGYGARTKPAGSKHDELWGKALAIEDATGHRAVLVTLDVVGVPRDLSEKICTQAEEKYKLPRSAIALNASHTHSGPVVRGNLMAMYSLDEDQSRRVTEYRTALIDKVVKVIGDALSSMQPAKLSWGVGQAGFAINRRNNKPEGQILQRIKDGNVVGPSDHELPILAVHGEDGKLRAIVGGYACHATVLDSYFISADWPGAAQNELERRHPGALAMFVAGCGGDQNPLPRRSVALMEKYGAQFADGADAALKSLRPLPPTLKTVYEEIDLPFGTMPTRAELELATKEPKPRDRWSTYLLKQWDRDGSLPEKLPYPIQVWRLGDDLTWVLLGGEVVVDFSLRLKAEHGPKKMWVSAYSNDVMAYIPSRRVLAEGGYEGGEARYPYGLPAVWDASVEQKIIDASAKLITEAAK